MCILINVFILFQVVHMVTRCCGAVILGSFTALTNVKGMEMKPAVIPATTSSTRMTY